MTTDYDVIIAGGGMVGASLAVALAETGSRIAIIEAVAPGAVQQPSYDDRGLALSLSSQRILQLLGIWDQVAATANPIRHIHVSDQHHFGFVRLHAETLNLSALGYVVLARELGQVLLDRVNRTGNIDLLCPSQVRAVEVHEDRVTVKTGRGKSSDSHNGKLLVAADGSQSRICEMIGINRVVKDYNQTAIVTNITTGKPHRDTAYERFTTHGPTALLPLSKQCCAAVFTVNSEDAETFMKMDDDEFIRRLQGNFGYRLGVLSKPGSRKSYPLKLVAARDQVQHRLVVLGNAAHTIHPNGAQGFNLCLRDIAGLAEVLVPALRTGGDPGREQLLNRYGGLRKTDQLRIIRFTDGLVSIFCNDLPQRVVFRNLGMLFIDLCPLLKKTFTRHAMGMSGHQPAMVRGIPL